MSYKKFNLHYSALNSSDDIEKFSYTSNALRFNEISDYVFSGKKCVFLLAVEHSKEFSSIFVFDRSNIYALRLLEKDKCIFEDVFLFEYESYEAAYQNALDMMEPNKLCYDPS